MPHATVERLLATVDPLPHPARIAEVARTARELAAGGRLVGVLAELESRGTYERRLAALAALAGRQTAYLAARLTDPDQVVRGHALRAVRTLPVPDEAVEAAFDDASAVLRRQLTRAVLDGRRTELAERLVVRLRDQWGDLEAARFLPACSPEFTARLLPELAHAVNSWAPLAKRHPDLVLDLAEHELADLPRNLALAWWERRGAGIAAATPARAERVLRLLERHSPVRFPAVLHHRLGALAAADAEQTVRRLTDPQLEQHRHDPVPAPSVLRKLVQADPPSLPVLGRHWLSSPRHFTALLRAVPPSRRGEFFDAATAGVETSAADIQGVLSLLPRERRWAEARRWLPRARAADEFWGDILETVAHLPVGEAQPELLAATRRPDADDRALAWPHLIANAGRSADPAVVQDLLTLMQRLRNEQEPVRSPALEALAGLPPTLFTAAGVEPLDQLVLDALQARDSSYRTRNALRRLAVAVLREHAVDGEPALLEWALRAIERISGHTGSADLGRLDHTLRRGQEHQVFEALRPWLEKAADNAEHGLLLALTGSLGKRARRMPQIQELLVHAVRFGNDTAFVSAAGHLLSTPGTRAERAATIVELEPSAAVLWPVQNALTRTRTDLLDLLLAETAPYGRFLKPGTRRPLPSTVDAHRWLPRQQQAAARLAAAAAADASLPVYSRAEAIRLTASIPVHGLSLALEYAGSADVVLAEAALGALAWTDRPAEALPTLLAHVGGDRARVAVYAASRAARFVQPTVLAGQLEDILTASRGIKVTSRKEAVRLAAEHLPIRQAALLLGEVYRAPGQHPDVQAVAAAFSTELLTDEQIWELLADAARSTAPQVRRAVLATDPFELPAPHRPRYARLVAEVCESTDADVANPALTALPRWAKYAPDSLDVVRRKVTDLSDRAAWRRASMTLGSVAASGLPHPVGGGAPGSLLHRTSAELLAAVRAGEPDASADRDLPARQRITALAEAVPDRPVNTALTELADQLADEPSLNRVRVSLLRRRVDLRAEPSELTDALRDLGAALHDRPAYAVTVAEQLGSSSAYGPLPAAPEAVLVAAEQLASEGELANGLIATALIAAVGPRLGWPEEWRAALRSLRRHPVPDVREAALVVSTERE